MRRSIIIEFDDNEIDETMALEAITNLGWDWVQNIRLH